MSTLPLLVLLLLPLAVFLSAGNWQGSLLYTVVIGFLQDPLRKLTPDQPAIFVGLSLLGLLVSSILLIQRPDTLNLARLFGRNPKLVVLIQLFLGLILLQTMYALFNGRPIAVVGIGLGFYLAPLVAAWNGFYLAFAPRNVMRFLRLYLAMALLFTVSLLMDFSGVQSLLFDEVGPGLQIHVAELGAYVQGMCGLWRSSEVAAWSLGAASCFVMILAISSRNPVLIAAASALMSALLVISTLTGRRKVVVLVFSFLAFYALLLLWRSDSKSRLSTFTGLGVGGLLLFLFNDALEDPTDTGNLGVFLRRSGTVWDQLGDRWQTLGTNVIWAALEDGGLFGSGLGASAQGARSLGLTTGVSSWAGEGGLGKITLELGLPGLFLIVLIVWNLARLFGQIITMLQYAPPAYRLLNIGLIAFLASNVPNFIVATQVYGDPFVLTVLGLIIGFVLAPTVLTQSLSRHSIHAVASQATLDRR